MLIIPIGDENPKSRTPYVNYTLIAINVLVFLMNFPIPSDRTLASYALTPSHPTIVTMVTSMFLHAGIFHLVGNMLFLWIFGDNVEDKLGHVFYVIFYLACGFAADGAQIVAMGASDIPTLGASGAISGVIGAYVLMFPHARIKMLVWFYFFINTFLVRSVWWIGFWFAQQLFFGLADISGKGGVAYWAHIGGFVVALAAAALVKWVIAPSLFTTDAGALHSSPAAVKAARGSLDDVDWEPEPVVTYALLRADGADGPTTALVNQIAAETGERPADVAQRIKATRGMLARNIDKATAQRIAQDLKMRGVRTVTVPDIEKNRPAVPFQPARVSWDGDGLKIDRRLITWDQVFLVLGARIGGGETLDLFCGPRTRLRITNSTELRFVDPTSNRTYLGSVQALAKSIQGMRLGAAMNEGVNVLAGHGLWSWLAFPSEAEYEDYAFWVYNLTLRA